MGNAFMFREKRTSPRKLGASVESIGLVHKVFHWNEQVHVNGNAC